MTAEDFKKWTGHDLSKAEREAILKNKACIRNLRVLSDTFSGFQPIKMEWVLHLAETKESRVREGYVEWLIRDEFDWSRV